MNGEAKTGPRIMLVAGEPSGDALGGELMQALKDMTGGKVGFSGVGGARMEEQGLASIFPMTDISVMGPREVVPRLPLILRRIRQTANFAIAHKPDVMVIIDSPDFTHLVARRVAKKAPRIPIVNYVSPSVWAWRRGRARAMARYLRRVLALLPFEPDFLRLKPVWIVSMSAIPPSTACLSRARANGFAKRIAFRPRCHFFCCCPVAASTR